MYSRDKKGRDCHLVIRILYQFFDTISIVQPIILCAIGLLSLAGTRPLIEVIVAVHAVLFEQFIYHLAATTAKCLLVKYQTAIIAVLPTVVAGGVSTRE